MISTPGLQSQTGRLLVTGFWSLVSCHRWSIYCSEEILDTRLSMLDEGQEF